MNVPKSVYGECVLFMILLSIMLWYLGKVGCISDMRSDRNSAVISVGIPEEFRWNKFSDKHQLFLSAKANDHGILLKRNSGKKNSRLSFFKDIWKLRFITSDAQKHNCLDEWGSFRPVHVLLSRFYLDFILILSWFYPDFIQILSWFYSNFIQIKLG